jgi:hypothetical protein
MKRVCKNAGVKAPVSYRKDFSLATHFLSARTTALFSVLYSSCCLNHSGQTFFSGAGTLADTDKNSKLTTFSTDTDKSEPQVFESQGRLNRASTPYQQPGRAIS